MRHPGIMMNTTNAIDSIPSLVLCETGTPKVGALESLSPFCLKVHRALKLAGLRYTTRRGAPRDFRHLNPTGQVPVLLVNGTPIADSTKILRAIIDLSPHRGLEPEAPRLQAEAWLWEDWADRAMNGWLVAARWADDANWPGVRAAYFGEAPWFVRTFIVPQLRRGVLRALSARDVIRGGHDAAREDFRAALNQLEQRAPQTGFWLGTKRPTLADIAIFAQVHSLRTPLTPSQAREVKLRPALTDWLDRVDEATRTMAPLPRPNLGSGGSLRLAMIA